MKRKYEKIKEKYILDFEYYDKVYVDKEEQELIYKMKGEELKAYVEENNLNRDLNNTYYRIILWDIDDEEFKNLIIINNGFLLNKIKSQLTIIISIIFIVLLLFIFA
ncbi:hypothetical protein EDC18_10487 [Natranaerovirga pectinivora]|uniref:Uncharacterized protein n=1 Tax=Natranaerovirga pectinivora TaxID=682400 RepID=A0A4R3MK45_9FIRM|nr:hypothetical protein [Natranaerovirga pectinivora]TCT14937.1 hypothetical protein EDC18_10487 [Natranaerovirga pectinivora]